MKKLTLLLTLLCLVLVAMSVTAQEEGITFWITGGENDSSAVQAAAAAFTEETGIPVTVEAVDWGDAYSRYLTAINSGTGADLFAGGMSWGISLGGVGGLVDLAQAFPDGLQGVLDVNNPEFVNAIIAPTGEVYGVPFNQDLIMMFYMPENLAAVGYDAPPATWEEFTEVVNALNEAGLGGAGFGWGHVSWIGFQPFLAQAGGSWYNEDCSAAAINSEEGLVALEYFTSLYEDLGFPAEQASTAGFSTGEQSIVFDGEWAALGIDPSYPDLVGKWAMAPMPAGPAGNNATFIGGKMIGIFSFSPNQEAAWEFIKWLQTSEAAAGIAEQYFGFTSLFIPTQNENLGFIMGGDGISAPIAAQLESTTAPANCPGWEESNAEINLAIQSVVFEGMAFEDALLEMEDLLNAGLEEYGN